MGYRYDTRHLSGQQQAIISRRDRENELLSGTKMMQAKEIYPLKIFMKLGVDSTSQYNGTETINIYRMFAEANGSVWFSTDSLATGMAEAKRCEFLKVIKNMKVVEMYFAVSKTSDGVNKMIAHAEIVDIKTDKDGISSPDSNLTPAEWVNDKNKIWIKLRNIKDCNGIECKDFKIATTGTNLMSVISKSQYHFGYIIRN